ncbi:MAG TPA: hypothetical protein VFM55_05290 [Micromonosporaceae bacterium]|nr:hypothetical protein [Micromonosporaceae bacterium]
MDTSDKVASVAGALAGIVAVLLTIHQILRHRRGARSGLSGDALVALWQAQHHDATRHRYRFFGDHIPSLTKVYVRQQVVDAATAQRTVGVEVSSILRPGPGCSGRCTAGCGSHRHDTS